MKTELEQEKTELEQEKTKLEHGKTELEQEKTELEQKLKGKTELEQKLRKENMQLEEENWKEKSENEWELLSDMQVERAFGDSVTNHWTLNNVFIRKLGKKKDDIRFEKQIDTNLTFNLLDLGQRAEINFAMTTPELIQYRKKEEEKGNHVAHIDISKYERTAYPFAAYVLTIIGISVASVKSREGVGKNLVIGLCCGLVYVFFMKMTSVAAVNIGWNTLLSVWFPNIIFSTFALILFYRRLKN